MQGELEDELGMGGEDHVLDLVHGVMETEIGGAGGMLTLFEPLIVHVASNPSKFVCEKLQTSSALSLSKYMLIRQVTMILTCIFTIHVLTVQLSVINTFNYFLLYWKSLHFQLFVLI